MYKARGRLSLLLGVLFLVLLPLAIDFCTVMADSTDRTLDISVVSSEQSSGFTGQIVLDLNMEGAIPNPEVVEKIAEYREINEDVTGWISIEEWDIDYPVLYSTDNKAYLRHDIYGNYDVAGCIYLDANYGEIRSPIKLIHGHNMKNKTMFGHIPQMLFWDTLDDAPLVYYCDDLGAKTFKIFSVFSVDATKESVIISKQANIEELLELKQDYIDRSWVECTDIPSGTEMLMLNTCWYGLSGQEHFLHCIVVAARIN